LEERVCDGAAQRGAKKLRKTNKTRVGHEGNLPPFSRSGSQRAKRVITDEEDGVQKKRYNPKP